MKKKEEKKQSRENKDQGTKTKLSHGPQTWTLGNEAVTFAGVNKIHTLAFLQRLLHLMLHQNIVPQHGIISERPLLV